MDIESELLKEHSRARAERIVRWIGGDRKRFRVLMEMFLGGDYRAAQAAAMAVGICAERRPALAAPYLKRMIARMEEPGVHDAVRRAVVRLLQNADIPPALMGTVADACFRYLSSQEVPVAIRAFAMTVLGRIAAREPELGRELRLVIEQHMPWGSSGFRACAARVLADLDRGVPREQ